MALVLEGCIWNLTIKTKEQTIKPDSILSPFAGPDSQPRGLEAEEGAKEREKGGTAMTRKFQLFGLLLLIVSGSVPATAGPFTAIPSPDSTYLASTTYLDLSYLEDFDLVTSVTDGTLTVSFDKFVEKRTVPISWLTWSEAPDSQRLPDEPLPVLFLDGTSLTITLSQGAFIFGFEAEPEAFDVFSMAAKFYDSSSTLLGTITSDVDGSAGARLFAASVDPIWSVEFSCPGCSTGFAIGAIRYSLEGPETVIPEPATLGLVGAGILTLAGLSRRKTA